MSHSTENTTFDLNKTIILNGEEVLTAIYNYFNDPEIINKYDKILDELKKKIK
jgi:hypothetical protein